MKDKTTIKMHRFAIVHFGATEDDGIPFYMKANHNFTSNGNSQFVMWFESCADAYEELEIVNGELAKFGHPLAGHLFVRQLALVDAPKPETDGHEE